MYCWKRSPYSGLHYKHKAVRCHARNVKFAVISCFITPNWKHVAGEWRQRWLTWSITIGTRLRPGLQGAGKTLVYSQQYTSHQRRQLLLLFHPSDQHSCAQSHLHLLHSTAYSLGLSVLFWRCATWHPPFYLLSTFLLHSSHFSRSPSLGWYWFQLVFFFFIILI